MLLRAPAPDAQRKSMKKESLPAYHQVRLTLTRSAMKQRKNPKLVRDDTCYAARARYCVPCDKCECRNWISKPKCQNCVMIAAQSGPMTLQEIGKIYGLTRMRICQIEKQIQRKIAPTLATLARQLHYPDCQASEETEFND